ncbi:MAG: ADOP family duplicated permease [Bryobacteraceae bacterium]
MRKLLGRIQYLFRRNRIEADLAEEMEFHRQMLARDFSDRAAASRAWGNTTLAREDARAVWLVPWIESCWRDLAYGVRGLRRERGFTAVAVTALAIAIGLNASLFTVFNAIALRPWAVKDPGRVVNVLRILRKGPRAGSGEGFGVAEWRYLSEHSKAFTGLLLTRNGEPVQGETGPLRLTWVTGNYFAVLGVEMARGRGFVPEEDRPLAPEAVAVLSYTTWRNRFGGDPEIVGKTVRLDEIPFTVVGVAGEGFTGTDPSRVDLWAPLSARRVLRPHDADVLPFLTDIHYCCSSMAGRLTPGYTREQAAAEIALLADQAHAPLPPSGEAVVASGTALLESVAPKDKGKIVPALAAMFAAMTLILLLACANVGNLLLARAAARRQEIAVRLSLGGSRARLVRQLLVESFALALAGAATGLAIAWKAPAVLVARMVPEVGMALNPDWRVCAYTAGLAVLACLVFGLAPALQATHGRIAGALKREAPLSFSRVPLRSVLLAAQVAISVILLAGAGLLVRGLQHAQQQDPGFRVEGVTVAALELPAAEYSGKRSQIFTAQLLSALSEPGVPAAAMATQAPMASSRSWTTVRRTSEPAHRDRLIQIYQVSGAYFQILGIPLVAGRNFTSGDTGRQVVLLNQTAARQLWGGQEAVGKTIESNNKTWQVAGVVKDAYTSDLNTVNPTLYWPITGSFGVPKLLLGDSSAAARERVTAIVRGLEPKGRVTFTPLSDNLRSQLAPTRYAATLAGALGLLALALASIGMSGVFAYMVRQRTREIGLRMALGAHPGQVVRLVLASNLRALAWGLAAGLAGAFAATRLLRSMMNGVSPFDPLAYAGVFALLIAAAAAASALPARRAARVDPVTALRWE